MTPKRWLICTPRCGEKMSNEIKFNIKEDRISEYLDTISNKVDNQAKQHLTDMAKLLTGTSGIQQYIAPWNPNLFLSGKDQSKWIFEQSDDRSSISVNYTGMTARSRSYDFKVWWEFSEEYQNASSYDDWEWLQYSEPFERTLARDYAYYQETGEDEVAEESDARNQQYIEKGIEDTYKTIINKSAGYLKNIINNRR